MVCDGKIGIVMVNYNGEKFQNDCVESVYASTYKKFDIIVIDNNSSDNSVSLLRQKFPDVIILDFKENHGVAKGNNIGIKYCIDRNYEYVLLLNNDTVLDSQMLELMISKADKKTISVPKIYYYEPDNELWFAGGYINWNRATAPHIGKNEVDQGQYDSEKNIEYSPTCCFLIHRDIFEVVGLMDEKYFMYYDDVDFCARVIKNNFSIKYVPKAQLWHKVSSSSGGEDSLTSIYYCTRNRLYFIDKFYDKKIKIVLFFYLSRVVRSLKWLLTGDIKRFKTMTKGISDYHSLKRRNDG